MQILSQDTKFRSFVITAELQKDSTYTMTISDYDGIIIIELEGFETAADATAAGYESITDALGS